ncbi:Ig-like domain-containing protein, partial [Burkholderia sp. S171]|uniref:Ig-like domain-containing protein n=1 Tax=Burkholderia sp. S171 TaxID=1641860 RepID=UPI001C20C138
MYDHVGNVYVPSGGSTTNPAPAFSGYVSSGLQAGETLVIYRDGQKVGVATFAAGVNWTFDDSGVGIGTHSYYAQVENSAGAGPRSNTFTFTEASSGAVLPLETVSITSLTDHTSGANIPAGGSTKDTSPVVHGTVSSSLLAGETLAVYRDGVKIGTATMSGTSWTFNDSNVGVGSHSYYAQVQNSAGNGAASSPYAFTEASSAAVLPLETVAITSLTDHTSGANIPAGGSTSDTSPVVHGTVSSSLLAGETLAVYRDGTKIGTATMSGTSWTFNDSGVGVGSHSYYAQVQNSAGNGPASSPYAFNETSAVAGPPVITDVQDAVGPIQGTVPNNGTTDDNQPTIKGTGTVGDTVYLYVDKVGNGQAVVDATGHWSIKSQYTLNDGIHIFTATQFLGSDANQSVASNSWSITVDTSVPAKPPVPVLTNDSGVSIPAGSTSNDGHPHISGTGKAGDIITVYDGATQLGSVKIDTNGNWTFTPSSDLSTGAHNITVTDTNAAGTTGPKSDPAAFTFTVS